MATFLDILYFLLLAGSSVTAGQENCPYQECHCKKEEINCNELGLTKIPSLTANKTGHKFLLLETNNITRIPTGSLPPNLVQIDMLRNPIITIDEDAFNDSLETLGSLSFSATRFTRISDSLLHLRALTSFDLYDTWIQDWNVDVMKHIALTMQTLYLVNVSLHTWPTWMQYFSHLTELSLESNFLSVIPDNALDMLADSLQILSLNNNNFTSIPRTVSTLISLQSLFLDFNQISQITWLPQSGNLTNIAMAHNKFADAHGLNIALRSCAQSLNSIELLENSLTIIPDLSYLTQVDYLDLSHNLISNPNSGSLSPNITTLSLDYNLLPAIPIIFTTLPALRSIQMSYNVMKEVRGTDIPLWIEEIDISSNLITEITDTCFPENSNIYTLSLDSNPIVAISQSAFKNLQQLGSLNLQYTKLTRLPLALATLTSLTWLEIDGNENLVCTCMEKNLASWFLTRQTIIGGGCGQTDILFFFSILSQSCP